MAPRRDHGVAERPPGSHAPHRPQATQCTPVDTGGFGSGGARRSMPESRSFATMRPVRYGVGACDTAATHAPVHAEATCANESRPLLQVRESGRNRTIPIAHQGAAINRAARRVSGKNACSGMRSGWFCAASSIHPVHGAREDARGPLPRASRHHIRQRSARQAIARTPGNGAAEAEPTVRSADEPPAALPIAPGFGGPTRRHDVSHATGGIGAQVATLRWGGGRPPTTAREFSVAASRASAACPMLARPGVAYFSSISTNCSACAASLMRSWRAPKSR